MGEGDAQAKQRALEAREEDSRVTRMMMEKWEAAYGGAMAAGLGGALASSGADMDESERSAVGQRQQEVMTRKELVGSLERAVQERRVGGCYGEEGVGAGHPEGEGTGVGGAAGGVGGEAVGRMHSLALRSVVMERRDDDVSGGQKAVGGRRALVERLQAKVEEGRKRKREM